MKKIKLLLADDNENTRSSIKMLLELDEAMDIVDEAASGEEVLEKVNSLEPEIVIMDVNMPGIDGIEATRHISLYYPRVFVIIISVNDELHNFRKAMLAGAKEYLVKPLSPEELNSTVRKVADLNRKSLKVQQNKAETIGHSQVEEEKKLVSVFGNKGGIGKSVLSSNLAVAMARKHKGIGLIDLDVQFGDIALMMNLNARKTIAELLQEVDALGKELLEDYVYERNGVNILAAPNRPEYAELVTPRGVRSILEACRQVYHYTFIDTSSFIDERLLTALEMSDLILLLVSLDIPTIKNVKKGLDILRSLQVLSKTRLILNRSSGVAGIEARDVERVLDMKISAEIPSDGKLVVSSLNQGFPFVKTHPMAPISRAVFKTLELIIKQE